MKIWRTKPRKEQEGDTFDCFSWRPSLMPLHIQEPAIKNHISVLGLLCSSDGKESACNTGDPGSIPGLGRFPEEGTGYPLQCSWASLVAQLVNNLPAMQETWVLGWEDPLEKGKATHSSIRAWRIPWTVHGVAESRTWLSDFHFTMDQASADLLMSQIPENFT